MKYTLYVDPRGKYHLVDNEQNLISASFNSDIQALLNYADYTTAPDDDLEAWYASGTADSWLRHTPMEQVLSFNSINGLVEAFPELFI